MIVWNVPIALVGALREAPLQKCPYYLLQTMKEMVQILPKILFVKKIMVDFLQDIKLFMMLE
ncbi:hypothetical protein [Geitlerinema sp. PCC 9228]|uniref:hypothetical protein n=1 Tax=Geitlerinema sp. PCC 9228 TaxID=111611 RepID=UPI0008F9D980|nr:hypothetical protein [Geitlerinema sp. PCC 9228]